MDSIEKLTQLAQTMIADSQLAFETSLANAQSAYDVDSYEDANFHIKQALMLNKNSEEATILANKIETLPQLLPLLEQAKTANVENKYEQELRLTKEIITLSPERKSAIDRKQVLVELISNKNFKSAITQAYQAIKQGDADKAKQKLSAAKRIFPNRSEIVDATNALQQLEKQQRFESHQQASQTAMAGDDWLAAKKQLDLALQEQPENEAMQSALRKTTTIIALQNEFDQHLTNPYRLANQQLATQTKAKLNEASKYSDISPSLNKKTAELSTLLDKVNQKIDVKITSDNQTNILVRGVGVVGLTKSKTIQLTPGHYKFEGKRKGYKSKLVNVLIPYDQSSYQLNIICDEPI